ncbi:hypothetical protein JCM10908_001377 [Rhodotorula pacifica]|uniref:Bos1p n=1 Tax=Rhodotorula pacifica TaxID=1495444 RepID=UPI00316B685A
MNSLYTLALRQSSSLSSDIQHLSSLSTSNQFPSSSSPIHSQITQGFTQLERTVEDYNDMAKREIVTQIREKALGRVGRFRDELGELRTEYERVKAQQKTAADRSELFNNSAAASSSSISHSPAASSSSSSLRPTSTPQSQARYTPNSPWVPSPSAYPHSSPSPSNPGYGYDTRTNAALKEHDFLGQTGQAIDAYLAQGQAVLGNLASQRDVLKGTQRRLLSAANTLGLSRSTITFIERRTKEDYWILIIGGTFTIGCFWLIWRWLG